MGSSSKTPADPYSWAGCWIQYRLTTMANVHLSPWQVFSLIFFLSYMIIKYLNNILATFVITTIYGGLMEIISKYLYVWNETQITEEPREKYREVLLEEDTDEELEEKYANIDVNFDESETEEEEDYVPRANYGSKKFIEMDEVQEESILEDELNPALPSITEDE